MKRTLRFLLWIVFIITLTITIIFSIQSVFSFRECPTIANYPDPNGVRCSRVDGTAPYSGVIFALPIDSITQEGDQFYLHLRYPIIGSAFWIPLDFQLGIVRQGLKSMDGVSVTLCSLSSKQCAHLSPSEVKNRIASGELVSSKVNLYPTLLQGNLYFKKCLNLHSYFVKQVGAHKSLFPKFLPQWTKNCAPPIGQIYTH